MKTVKTEKGTELPLVNLKGKDYLMVAYRLQWLTESVPNYTISTELVLLSDEQTVAKAVVSLFDKDGKLYREASATKRETKKDFMDHTEKAETAAVGRALAMLGFGTQHALSDLDEGTRLADSPLESTKKSTPKTESKSVENPTTNVALISESTNGTASRPRTTFRKAPKEETTLVTNSQTVVNGIAHETDDLGLN